MSENPPDNHLLHREFTRADLPLLRLALTETLERAGLPESARQRFGQAVLEVVTNAVLHGGGRGTLAVLDEDDTVRCVVTDSGPGFFAALRGRARAREAAAGGHGLLLARTLAEHLYVLPGPDNRGTTVMLDVPRESFTLRPVH